MWHWSDSFQRKSHTDTAPLILLILYLNTCQVNLPPASKFISFAKNEKKEPRSAGWWRAATFCTSEVSSQLLLYTPNVWRSTCSRLRHNEPESPAWQIWTLLPRSCKLLTMHGSTHISNPCSTENLYNQHSFTAMCASNMHKGARVSDKWGHSEIFSALVTDTQGNKSITQTSSSKSSFYHPLSLCHTVTRPSSPQTYSLSLNTVTHYLHSASFLKNFHMIHLPFFCQTIHFTSHFCLSCFSLTTFLLCLYPALALKGFHRQPQLSLYCFSTFLCYLCFSNLCVSFPTPVLLLFALSLLLLWPTSLLSSNISHPFSSSKKNLRILSLVVIHQSLITSCLILFKKKPETLF